MSNVTHLRLIDGNGQLVEEADQTETIKALEASLTRAENVIKGLRNALAEERQKTRKQYPLDEAFEDHKAKLVAAGLKGKKRCKLTDDRIDAMGKLFAAGYTLEDFRLANTGLAEFRYVVFGKRRQSGADDALQVDLEFVCSKARRFEEVVRLGAIVEKARAGEGTE
jgi:hypothetical protein